MKNQNKLLVGWEALLVLVVLLLVKGAYTAQQLVPVAIFASVAMMGTIMYRLLTKNKMIRMNWLAIGCFLVAVSYGWTLLGTLSIEQSLLKMLEWLTYALLLLWIPVEFIKNARRIIVLFGGIFVLVHVVIMLDIWGIEGSLLSLPNGLSFSGVRLNGLLQYANATGAIAGALWLYSLYAYMREKPWRYVDVSIMTGLAFILWMTESRGALLIVLLSFFIGLFVVQQQLRYFLLFVTTAISSLLGYVIIIVLGVTTISVMLTVVVMIGCAILVEKYESIWRWTCSKWLIPSAIVVMSLIILGLLQLPFIPNVLQNRLSLSTFADRFVYMQDAWQAVKASWLFGAGGEAWQFAMFEYQSAPYIANDIHMFYEQHWLETGVFGFIIVVGLLAVALYFVNKENRALLPAIIVLLGHACFDFTLSYALGIVLLLLFLYEGLGERVICRFRNIATVLPVSIVCLAVCVLATFWQQGENAFAAYERTGQGAYLERAIEKNPFATRYYEVLAEVGSPVEAYEHILRSEPHHARIHFYVAQAYEQIDVERALQHYELALKYDRYDRVKYELAQEALMRIGTAEALALQVKLTAQLQKMEKLVESQNIADQREFMVN